jgi:hypothetical protein
MHRHRFRELLEEAPIRSDAVASDSFVACPPGLFTSPFQQLHAAAIYRIALERSLHQLEASGSHWAEFSLN